MNLFPQRECKWSKANKERSDLWKTTLKLFKLWQQLNPLSLSLCVFFTVSFFVFASSHQPSLRLICLESFLLTAIYHLNDRVEEGRKKNVMNEKRNKKRNLSSLSDPTMSEHEKKSKTKEDKKEKVKQRVSGPAGARDKLKEHKVGRDREGRGQVGAGGK